MQYQILGVVPNVTFLPSSKEFASNAGDPGLIPGSGRSPRGGKSYPLQYSWASLVAQLVKNPPAMWETWVQRLGWEDPLEKAKATHSSILAWRTPWTVQSMDRKELTKTEQTFFFYSLPSPKCNIGRIRQCVIRPVLSLSRMHLKFLHVVHRPTI